MPTTKVRGLISEALDPLPNCYDKVQYDAKTNLILNHLIDMSAQNYGWGKMLMN